MKVFRENEVIIWLVTAIILTCGYWMTQTSFFLVLSITALLMSRIAKIENEIFKRNK